MVSEKYPPQSSQQQPWQNEQSSQNQQPGQYQQPDSWHQSAPYQQPGQYQQPGPHQQPGQYQQYGPPQGITEPPPPYQQHPTVAQPPEKQEHDPQQQHPQTQGLSLSQQPPQPHSSKPNRIFCITWHKLLTKNLHIHEETSKFLDKYQGQMTPDFYNAVKDTAKKEDASEAAYTLRFETLTGTRLNFIRGGSSKGEVLAEWKGSMGWQAAATLTFTASSPLPGQTIYVSPIGTLRTSDVFVYNGANYSWGSSGMMERVWVLTKEAGAEKREVAQLYASSGTGCSGVLAFNDGDMEPVLMILTACVVMWKRIQKASAY